MSGIEPFIVPTIFAGFKACRSLLKRYKKKHTHADNDLSELDAVLREGPREIEKKWNPLAERQGRRFAQGDRTWPPSSFHYRDSCPNTSFTGKAISDMNNIKKVHIIYIEKLLEQHIDDPPPPYHPGPSSASSGDDRASTSPQPPNRAPPPPPLQHPTPVQALEQQTSSGWRLEASQHARIAVLEATRALADLYDRLSSLNPPPANQTRSTSRTSHSTNPSTTSSALTSPRPSHFCAGARLLQANPALSIIDIILPESYAPSYTCKFCYLDISSFQLFAMEWGEEHWTAIARCHIMACQSFEDRRAGFVCTGCEAFCGMDVARVRKSAVGLNIHMDKCLYMKAAGERENNMGFGDAPSKEDFDEDDEETDNRGYEKRQEQEYEHHEQRYASINGHMARSQDPQYQDDNVNASIGIGMSQGPRTMRKILGPAPGYEQDADPDLRAPWRPMTPIGQQFVPDMPGAFRTPS
jgi:hypothetical protein